MKTATLDAGGMSSMLDYRGVEKQLGRIPGVKQVTASIASNSATVEYDENVTNVAALKDKIEECGFHCAGRILPMHLCEPHSDHSAAPAKQAGHEHHAHPMQAMVFKIELKCCSIPAACLRNVCAASLRSSSFTNLYSW
jgi:Cu2+-exporting ATPase